MSWRFADVGGIADRPGDDAEALLRHRLLIYAGILMSGGGLLWGTIALLYGLPWQSLVPFGYIAITAVNLGLLALTRRFPVASAVQIAASLLLPFGFQWSLGGFAASGAVMLWAILALVGSLAIENKRYVWVWLLSFAVLTILSGVLDPHLAVPAPLQGQASGTLFFVVNIAAVSSLVFLLTMYFSISRDRALREAAARNVELRQTLDQLTASAEILKVIAQSRSDVTPVLDAIASAAARYCGAFDVTVVACPHGREIFQS